MLFELTNPEIAILMMSLFLFAVLLGFPIAFTLLAMGVGFGYYAYFDPTRMDHLLDNRIFSLLVQNTYTIICLLYTSPSPRDVEESRMPSSA